MTGARVRVALVGAGRWGREHAQVFAEREDVELVAIAARTPERTAARAAEYGLHAYTSVPEMIGAERPDLVSLSLPNQGHFAPTLEVIRAGVPLLVEKPLVFDLAEADTLLEEARRRNLFLPPLRAARATRPAGHRGGTPRRDRLRLLALRGRGAE